MTNPPSPSARRKPAVAKRTVKKPDTLAKPDADLPAALRLWRYRKGIVDFGRMRIVDTEGLNCRQRQVGGFHWRGERREAGAALALGEELEQEAAFILAHADMFAHLQDGGPVFA